MPKTLILGGGIGWCIRRLRASCALVSRKDNQGGEVGFLRDGGVRTMRLIINDAKRGSATECRYYLRSADSMSSILSHGGGGK